MLDRLNSGIMNPEGIAQSDFRSANPHPLDLEGKKVLLRWNGKHNGDVLLGRIAVLLAEKIQNVKILKAWEIIPESENSSQNVEVSQRIAAKLGELKPDIVISSLSD